MSVPKKRLFFTLFLIMVMSGQAFVKCGRAYQLAEYCTCKGVNRVSPYNYIEKTDKFTISDTMVFVWARLNDVRKSHRVSFTWIFFDDRGGIYHKYKNSWYTEDPASKALSSYDIVIWDYIPINSPDSIGKWKVILEIDGNTLFEQKFEVSSERDSYQMRTTITVMSTKITTTTALKSHDAESPLLMALIATALLSFVLAGLAFHALRKPRLGGREGKYLEYIAKLEDLRAKGRIGEEAYIRLRKEYEGRLKEEG
jgi:hypothetical protein